jgi:hypothetical protein
MEAKSSLKEISSTWVSIYSGSVDLTEATSSAISPSAVKVCLKP